MHTQAAAVSIEQGAAAAAANLPEVAAGAAREAAVVRDELIPRVSAPAWNTHKAGGSLGGAVTNSNYNPVF